ncbi:extracellular triacylglycerol lipase precursor [Pterulicium gracile]|uniref:Carboxylic ester hydrolase n=1 Tax=Pterulicium gracile TaxID=1884261 RepID=A0A5C3QB03_9AGAR|nr:extracellular triacylglycerol lipase precursor [Pterula gracilis]
MLRLRSISRLLSSWLYVAVLSIFVSGLEQTDPTVRLGNTKLVGRGTIAPTSGVELEFFGGMRFGEPPVGSLRFQLPIPFKGYQSTTFNATQYGAACLQPGTPDSSEDCLTINVFRPKGVHQGAKLPVMAWIYGGGFLVGRSYTYDGSGIVGNSVQRGTPVIFVNLNYRLGPFGFPQGVEAQERGALNLGLKDQLLALQWIQKNIEAFGGDRSKVTVFGQSAGAISIGSLFLNSGLEKVARAAIFESGQATTTFSPTRPSRQQDWVHFVEAVPACASLSRTMDTIPCLQKTDSATLIAALSAARSQSNEQFPWGPVIDGTGGMIPDLPSRLLERGAQSKIPFIAGTTLDEGTGFIPPTLNYTNAVVESLLFTNFTPPIVSALSLDKAIDKILELYPEVPSLGSPIGTGNETFGLSPGFKRIAMLFNDLAFQALRRSWSQVAAKSGVSSYAYLFTDPQLRPGAPYLGVTHADEVPYVFGATIVDPRTPVSSKQLSQMMMDYWTSFATSLTPNDGKGVPRPQWTEYTTRSQVLLELNGAKTQVIPDTYRKKQIAYINSNAPVFHHRRGE